MVNLDKLLARYDAALQDEDHDSQYLLEELLDILRKQVSPELAASREALDIIAERRFPSDTEGREEYELAGDYATDARYVYPNRESYLAEVALHAFKTAVDA